MASVEIAKAAGMALARAREVDAGITIDAMVMATAGVLDAIVITRDVDDFDRFRAYFPGVAVLSA